jgi:mono/diheme cytochrome c family protein
MKFLKFLGVLLAACGVFALIILGLAHSKYTSLAKERQPEPQELTLRVELQENWLAEGERIARMRGCGDCHGADYGGKAFIDDPGMGYFVGRNLTTGMGGIGADYSVEDYVRAIRYGQNKKGNYLRFMPSIEYSQMSDEGLGKLIVFLKSLPPINRNFKDLAPGPVAKVLFFFDRMPLLLSGMHIQSGAPVTVAVSENADFGQYLAASCVGCHRPDYSGGPIAGVPPSWPPASDLTPRGDFAKWTFEEFRKAMTTGERPDGRIMNSQFMPWTSTAAFNEMELRALYNYLKSLPSPEI